ncbi:MAG: phosphoribosylanthranilate isomerase [Candidatus Sericytochromatia bacterium]
MPSRHTVPPTQPLTRVKICGLTRLEDAQLAVDLGAWAVGYIFYPGSPRAAEPTAVARINAMLPVGVPKVGVFVNASVDEMLTTAHTAGLTHLQLHGEESPQCLRPLQQAGYEVLKALRLRSREDLSQVDDWSVPLVLDAAVPGQWGGSGLTANWELAAEVCATRPCFLAGGITPANARAARDTVQPWALDLASGVESAPGIKDPYKLRALFTALTTKMA